MDKTLACRLIGASTLAYGINAAGNGFQDTAAYDTLQQSVGFAPGSFHFIQPDGYNACYWGETADGAVILSFRGTLPPGLATQNPEEFFDVLLDWLNDAHVAQVKGQDLAGLVHAGFLLSLDAMWKVLDLAVLGAAAAGKPLYVTGHSKGGSLAYLGAYRLFRAGIKPAAVYSFAAARAGNRDFATAFDQVCPSAWRFEYRDDVVPHLPPQTGGWLGALQAHEAAATKFPADAPHTTDSPGVIARAEALIARLRTPGLPQYVSAGTLEFINWDDPPALQTDSLALSLKRDLSLAEKFGELKLTEIVEDHSSAGGYTTGACGVAAA
jgi:hypothetical protein